MAATWETDEEEVPPWEIEQSSPPWQQEQPQLEAPSWLSAPTQPAEFGSPAFAGQAQAIAQNPFTPPTAVDLGQSPILELPEDNGKGRLRSAGASFMQGGGVGMGTALSGFVRLLDAGAAESLQEASASTGNRELYEMAEEVRNRTPEQKEADIARDEIYKAGQGLAAGAKEAFVPNPKFKGEFFTDTIPSAGGQMVPTVALGLVNPAIAAAEYGLSSGQQGAEESIAAGDIADVDKVFFAYLGLGALSELALGVPANILKYAQAARKAGVGKAVAKEAILKALGKGAAHEAGQEGLEQVGQNLVAQQTFDPSRKTLEGVPESMAAGFLLGGAGAGAAAGVGAIQAPTTKSVPIDSKLTVEPAKAAGPEFIKSESTVDRNAAQDKLAAETDLPTLESQAAEATVEAKALLDAKPSTEAAMQTFQDASAKVQFLNEAIRKKKEAAATAPVEKPTELMTASEAESEWRRLVEAGNKIIPRSWQTWQQGQMVRALQEKRPIAAPLGESLVRGIHGEGYVREGDQYVYKPTSANASQGAPPPPAEQPASPVVEGTPAAGAAVESALDKANKWADEVLNRDPRSRSRTGIDPSEEAQRLAAIAIKGAVLIRSGVREFSAWSKRMIEQHGPEIQAQLQDLWAKANSIASDMTMAAETDFGEGAKAVAPGAKTKESGGVWFAGKNPQETATMMQERASEFLKGKTDQQAIEELVRLAGGDGSVQLDNQAVNFVIKDLLVRASNRAQKTTNPVEAVEAWSQVDRLAELSRRLGSEDARSLVSRKLAYRQIDWLMPVIAWRGIVKEQWRKALGIPEGQPLNESVITPEEAKKRGLPELNGEATQKITKLSKQAGDLPQGIRRNKVMDEMVKEIQKGVPMSRLDLLRDIWYSSVLMRVGTFVNVLSGSYATGASFTAMAALDRTARLHPVQAMKIVGQFIGGTIEGTLIAKEVASKGAWHLLPDAELRFSNLLSGKAGARFDNLEALLRRGNPLGVLAYTRRFMAALDYIGAEGTRDSQVLYAALTRGDQASLDALDRRFDKAENKRAGEQARAEMGAKASRAEVLVRKREILEQGVSEEIKEAAINTARRAAQNANPRGIPGVIYQAASKLPFWVRAPTGLAFIRAGMNMVQNAMDYMPGIGAISAARGGLGALPDSHPLKRFGMDIPIEERRMMWAAQGASLGIASIAAAMFLGDDDDEGMEISGSWRGIDPKKRSQLMELGERPNSIRFGKKGPWISFKQMPFAPPLAIVGTARDEQRFHKADWDGESFGSKLIASWLGGLLYVRDLSALSGIAGMFDANAWSTQGKPSKVNDQLSKWAAQSVGRAISGYIPSIIKEIDEFGDQSLYRPGKDELMGYWIRNIPYARRTVGSGPALNNFGEPIQLTPPPLKSWVGFGKDDDLYNTLGALASKGIFIPEPDRNAKIVVNGSRRARTEDEWYQFMKLRGPLLKASFTPNDLKWLKTASPEDAVGWLKERTDSARESARMAQKL